MCAARADSGDDGGWIHTPPLSSRIGYRSRAHDVHPVQLTIRILLTTGGAGIFVFAGWSQVLMWFGVVFTFVGRSRFSWLGQCVSYGYHKGARHEMVSKE